MELKQVVDLATVVGVIASLVGLAWTIRAQSVTLRASSYNNMVATSFNLYRLLFENVDGFTDLYVRLKKNPQAVLSDTEAERWNFFMVATFRHFDNLLYQEREKALDRKMWGTSRPEYAIWFQRHAAMFSEDLQRFVAEHAPVG
jgi:hypothetical protein